MNAHPDVLFQLRCALAHSYSTCQEQILGRGEKKTVNTFEFLLTDDPSDEIVRQQAETLFSVNLYALHDGFELAIADYEKFVRKGETASKDFLTTVTKIGSVFSYPPPDKISFETISTSTLCMGASGVTLNGFLPKDLEQSFTLEPAEEK